MRHFSGAKLGLAACALALAPVVAAAADEPSLLAPSSMWQLDYGDLRCRLARAYGEGDGDVMLMFEQYAPSEGFSLIVAGDGVGRYTRSDKISVRFAPLEAEPREVSFEAADFPGFGAALLLSDLQPGRVPPMIDEADQSAPEATGVPRPISLDVARIGAAERLELSNRSRAMQFELEGFSQAITALNHCSQDLLRHWGLDADQHRTMTRRTKPTNFGAVAQAIMRRYPALAADRREQADMMLRVMVDATGAITSCHIAEMTSAKYLKSTACEQFEKRAEFEPALDAAGQPMDSYYVTRVVYRMD